MSNDAFTAAANLPNPHKALANKSGWGRFFQRTGQVLLHNIGHQASLEKLNRLLIVAISLGFLITIATYGWVVHQKFTLQQLIQETQALQETNTAHSIQLNRLQSFTGIMKNAQASHWLTAPKQTLTLLSPVGQPLHSATTQAALTASFQQPSIAEQRWPSVTGY